MATYPSILELLNIDPKRARVKVTQTADPDANNEFTYTVPSDRYFQLISVTVSLAQGATQTPLPVLELSKSSVVFARFRGASAALNAATTSQYTWAPGLTLTAAGATTEQFAPIPDGLILPPGVVIASATAGKGANTNYGKAAIYGIEYLV